jgi:DNA-directed RNA polymerase subunit omega
VIYPSIDRLLNIVDSKYELVHIVADRAKVMKIHHHYQMPENQYKSKKKIGRALEEIEKNIKKMNWKRISKHQKLSERFIMRYKNLINKKAIKQKSLTIWQISFPK